MKTLNAHDNRSFFLINLFILFLAALGLHCCARAFSSCVEWGLLLVVVCGLLIVVVSLVVEHGLQARGLQQCGTRAQQLWLTGSSVQAQQLWCTGLVAPQHVGSSRTGAQTHVPCIGRQILNHCATREALTADLLIFVFGNSGFVLVKNNFLQGYKFSVFSPNVYNCFFFFKCLALQPIWTLFWSILHRREVQLNFSL